MNRFFRWCLLLLKRCFRRPGYWFILAAAPLLTLALLSAAREGSRLVTVALVLTDPRDPAAVLTRDSLARSSGAVRVLEFDAPDSARDAVADGTADAAWILGSLEEELRAYAETGWTDPVIRVVEREDNPLLMLARERLYAALFPALSHAEFDALMGKRFGVTDETILRERYDFGADLCSMVLFEDLSGGEREESAYLLSPVRGLLALLVLLTGLASALYAIGEDRRETFLWLSRPGRAFVPLLSHFLAELPAAAAALLSLWAAGLTRGAGGECLLMLAYCAACAVLSEVLRRLLRTEERLAAVIPAVLLISLALSPIFADLGLPLRGILPTDWYLRAAMLL